MLPLCPFPLLLLTQRKTVQDLSAFLRRVRLRDQAGLRLDRGEAEGEAGPREEAVGHAGRHRDHEAGRNRRALCLTKFCLACPLLGCPARGGFRAAMGNARVPEAGARGGRCARCAEAAVRAGRPVLASCGYVYFALDSCISINQTVSPKAR